MLNSLIKYEPPHDKTNKMICLPIEDSDQPGHLPCLISLCCPHEATLGPKLPIEHTARMPRLIWVFGVRTDHFVGFVLRWLIWKQPRQTSLGIYAIFSDPSLFAYANILSRTDKDKWI